MTTPHRDRTLPLAGTQIRLLLRVLRMHVLEEEAEWDAAPAMSYLEQLHMLAKDSGLPAFVDAAHVAPPPNLLVEVRRVNSRTYPHHCKRRLNMPS